MAMKEKWVLQAKKGDFYGLAEKFQLDPVTIRLLINRGLSTEASIRQYLYGTRADEYDPRLMKGAEEAAKQILEAIRGGEKIMIASDFDVDGVFSGEILLEALEEAGGKAEVYTPHRVKEGYGVNANMVQHAWEQGFTTMITCDNGIAAFEAVEKAKKLGMRVIITDHHECIRQISDTGEEIRLPEADVIVNPHQPGCQYPYPYLCGAGVAYKVVEILYSFCGLPRERSDRFLEYVAIATVADVMDLADENRIFVREGLQRLGHTENQGLQALMRVCQLDPQSLSSYHIGFVLGPCFNSAGRLDTAARAFRLLRAKGSEAEKLACQLKELNDSRKELTRQAADSAIDWVNHQEKLDDILVIPLPECHESIAGIVAGRVREKFHHPVIVFTKGGTGWKGSGRSIEGWNMFEGLLKCRDLLTHFGGHPMAAGMSMPEENLDELRYRINLNTGLTPDSFVPIIRIDAAMPLEYISEKLIQEFHLLEPFGKGNPKPLFAEKVFWIRRARVLGKNHNVLKLEVQNSAGMRMDALYFGDVEEFDRLVQERFGQESRINMYQGRENSVHFSLAYYPEINEYMGNHTIQMVISHID
ncbi:MAG: single-stranded-DNA-specific exonuclease RecJ [Clostridiales bacterium]|nr:single-stranded-DNA-specific exonuclease RecJ [Clostridiales bacterium]